MTRKSNLDASRSAWGLAQKETVLFVARCSYSSRAIRMGRGLGSSMASHHMQVHDIRMREIASTFGGVRRWSPDRTQGRRDGPRLSRSLASISMAAIII